MKEGIESLPTATKEKVDTSLFDNEIGRIAKDNPKEFGESLVGGLGDIDPQLVAEFKRDLAQLKPSAALIDALQEMVDEILANPQNYEAIRTKYLNQEVPEELLPAFFDPVFFGGLDLALIELEKNVQRPEPPVEMAEGGVASIAQAIAKMGRRGDTMLAHITPEEARLLKRRGGSGTINPKTGLPEFFIKKIFKSAKSILKGVGRAVNKIAKSDIGRIALTIAATYYMGPAGFNIGAGTFSGATLTAIQTAAGSTLVNLASGESLKDSLKNGIMSGATAGFGQAIGAALPADVTNPYLRTGIGTALAGTGAGLARGQSFGEALRSGVEGAAQSAALQRLQQPFTGTSQKLMSKLPQVPESFRTTVGTDVVDPITGLVKGTGKAFDTARSGIGGLFTKDPQDGSVSFPVSSPDVEITSTKAPIVESENRTVGKKPDEPLLVDEITDTVTLPFRKGREFIGDFIGDFKEGFEYGTPGDTYEAPVKGSYGTYYNLPEDATLAMKLGRATSKVIDAPFSFYQGLTTEGVRDSGAGQRGFAERAGDLVETGARTTYDYFSPSKREEAFLAKNDYQNAKNVLNKQLKDKVIDQEQYNVKLAQAAKRAEQKIGTLSKYGPAAALGLGALYLGGAFDSPQEEEGGLLFDPYTFQMFDRPYSPNMYSGLGYRRYNPYLYAQGGDVEKFPRKTGAINGPGTGTSDSIPAMLSDGEFVMTAKAVRSMGNGSRRKGAAKMYKLMRELEKRTA